MAENNITLTDKAAEHVKGFLAKSDHALGLRVGVKPTGCSGNQYVIEAADAMNDDDTRFESNGITLIVNELSMRYLQGLELDYVREGLNFRLQFNNPNVTDTCGCGESFTIDPKHTENE